MEVGSASVKYLVLKQIVKFPKGKVNCHDYVTFQVKAFSG